MSQHSLGLLRLKTIVYIPCRFPVSSAGIFSLLLIPTIVLLLLKGHLSSSRTDRLGTLARLMTEMTLIQSFRGDPQRQAPRLWQDRLGMNLAKELWRRQGRGLWWQAWANDGEAYLLLPEILWPMSVNSSIAFKRLDDMVVIASDGLHRQQLLQSLDEGFVHSSAGQSSLQRFCNSVLQHGPAVTWSPDGLASVSGAMAPLLQISRHGCLSLRLDRNQLKWQGVVGYRPFGLAPVGIDASPFQYRPMAIKLAARPDTDQALLNMQVKSMDLLFGSLLSKQIIQDSLDKNYGINQQLRLRVASLPLDFSLGKQPKGPFQASIQIQLELPEGSSRWQQVIDTVSQHLEAREFIKEDKTVVQKDQNTDVAFSGLTLWRQTYSDGERVVGGWVWQKQNGKPIRFGIALGDSPMLTEISNKPIELVHPEVMKLSADTAGLYRLGLLNGFWPAPVKQANLLTMNLSYLRGAKLKKTDWWWMSGQLILEQASTP
ncbi:hypothetical protein [Prochlorococcus sp. MIT 1303]|uniref:hypothetical protein n=1 Tax=Prochlorococcus sp. MIT 1303 TaxID=1723647 RepID=UPI0007B3498D|nr:hypothetical protein [Prochlorococcus sp. MIT 1303]KZR66583.1 hypothetical protein PMIT1303_00864 [Prochlorococcus sp. MIT 1303]